jgi:serine protease AprX
MLSFMRKLYFLLLASLLFTVSTQAQYSRYIIRFKDKKGTPHLISNPSTYLSAKAIARRSKYNISIDSSDLPLSPSYLDSIRAIPNVVILNQSKWLNQVCIRTTDATPALARINSFPFVQQASPVAARVNPGIISNKALKKMDADAVAEVNQPAGVDGVNDNYFNYGSMLTQIHIHEGEFLHNLGFRGEGVTIAVLDAGFFGYLTNPALDSVRLNNQVIGTWDYVNMEASVNEDYVHGANCFSIIASNRPGVLVGSSPKSKFWLLRTEDAASEYPVEEQNWVAAAEFADSAGVDMISSSLGYADFDDPSFNHSYAQRNGNTALITIGADLAAKKGMLISNSAGNSGNDPGDLKYVACPADGDSVFTVGATDANGNIAGISSWGPNGAGKQKPNVVSVGSGVIFAATNGNPSAGLGTSYSNPNMCGLVACLWQAFPELNNMAIIDAVQKSANRYNAPDVRYGYGLPNFKKAFAALVTKSFQGSVNPDGCVAMLNWSSKDNSAMYYEIERKSASDTGFIKIATIPAYKAPGFQVNNYTFSDSLKSIVQQTMQYRIKQVIADTTVIMFNGSHSVSTPCSVLQKAFTVSPNPFKGTISLYLNTGTTIGSLYITLTDTRGFTVYQYQGAAVNGTFNVNIPAEQLLTGIYILIVRDGKKVLFTKKLLK